MRTPVQAAVIVLLMLAAGGATAQAYPAKPIRFIVSYPPAGPADILARALAQKLGAALGQQVVIDNRPGANGNIGAELAAKAPADGYTLFMTTSSHAANMTLYAHPGYDLIRDFVHVTNVASYPLLLVAHPAVPARSVRELLALAKAKPGQLTFASAGSGGGAHLAAELFKSMAGIDMLHVPYKGTGPALLDVIGGQISLMFAGVSAALPQVRAGKLNALGISSAQRLDIVRELPTIAEAGVPGYQVTSWLGVSVPARTPQTIVKRLNAEIAKIGRAPDFLGRLAKDGAELEISSAQQFAAYVRAEIVKWAQVVKTSGARIE